MASMPKVFYICSQTDSKSCSNLQSRSSYGWLLQISLPVESRQHSTYHAMWLWAWSPLETSQQGIFVSDRRCTGLCYIKPTFNSWCSYLISFVYIVCLPYMNLMSNQVNELILIVIKRNGLWKMKMEVSNVFISLYMFLINGKRKRNG